MFKLRLRSTSTHSAHEMQIISDFNSRVQSPDYLRILIPTKHHFAYHSHTITQKNAIVPAENYCTSNDSPPSSRSTSSPKNHYLSTPTSDPDPSRFRRIQRSTSCAGAQSRSNRLPNEHRDYSTMGKRGSEHARCQEPDVGSGGSHCLGSETRETRDEARPGEAKWR
ncbi:hypothetical protein N431DRAFT_70542 [Stipitochalara longipes BDJ]|nr:hypothetical protein N431DRAFT_70542 [Stipitochalara longipes BDJ]